MLFVEWHQSKGIAHRVRSYEKPVARELRERRASVPIFLDPASRQRQRPRTGFYRILILNNPVGRVLAAMLFRQAQTRWLAPAVSISYLAQRNVGL